MNRPSRLLSSTVVAVVLLALLASGAFANRGIELSVASGELGRVRADQRNLTFRDAGGTVEVICEWFYTLRLNRTIAKTAGSIVGQVREASIRSCRGGTVRVLNLPWTITYVSFAGTLPNITSVRLSTEGWPS